MTENVQVRGGLPEPGRFMDRLRESNPRVPATRALMLVNLGVFLTMIGFGAGLWHSPNDIQLAWGANFGPATQEGQWWRLGTAMFIHFGILHLAMNLWALWDGGNFVERIYGTGRFAALYLGSGLAGNLVSLAMQGNLAVSAGASGAIFGLYGALLIALWHERQVLHPREFAWLFWGAAGFSVATVTLGFLVPGIDNAAHIGGLASGALLGIAFYRPLRATAPMAPLARFAAGGATAAALGFFIVSLPPPGYRWSEESAARQEIAQFLRQEAAIGEHWSALITKGQQRELSFAQLATRLDTDIAERYERSFEQLSRLPVSPELPSAAAIRVLRGYADIRREESHLLAEGFRTGDAARIGKARELGRQAAELARQFDPANQKLPRRPAHNARP